jgi:tetratricopeptide (TPR) repeat protein/tRNA A-37 threonylcarbamoyl transferase component Bud32
MTDTLERLRTALADRYAIDGVLGRGGMATVYLAEDLKHGRKVAIKVLRADLAAMLGAERFLQEIRLTANLQHPNIVALYDSGEADGLLYYVMPYVEGESLRDRLNRESKISARDAVRIASEVAGALEYAHRRNIVHRDIKPENILLLEDGGAQVADFGVALATAAAVGADSDRLTAVGMAVGTPAYMSPEQASGESSADARSDIYSLGCVLYEMLSGDPPFTADTAQKVLSQQVTAVPRPLAVMTAEVPEGLVTVVERALTKDPTHRYQAAQELAEALEHATISGATPTVGSGAWLVEQVFHPRMLGVLGAYLAVSVAAIAGMKWVAGKYLLSAELPWVVGVALLSLLPAVAIVTWRRTGTSGRAWRRVAGIVVPANAVGAVALLFVMFGSSDLGAATVTVSVRDETGTWTERVVPKSAYRRRVAFFPLTNRTNDTALSWLQFAVPAITTVDLEQDPFVRVLWQLDFQEQLEDAGRPDGLRMPVAQQRQIAARLHMSFFVTGAVQTQGDDIILNVELYDAESGGLVQRYTHSADDLLGAVDSLSRQIRRDMGIPHGALETVQDLPANQMLTDSPGALKAYVEGWAAFTRRDFEVARERLEAAIAADESFAIAYLFLYQALHVQGETEEANAALARVLEHDYRLSERMKLAAKLSHYFIVEQDATKAMAIADMWTELYPEDLNGHIQRAQLLALRNDLHGVIGELRQVLALDSNQYEVMQSIGTTYQQLGMFDSAGTYLQAYAQRFPNDPQGYLVLGQSYLVQGRFGDADAAFERMLLIDPRHPAAFKGLGDAARLRGAFADARNHYETALEHARTDNQRLEILGGLTDLEWAGGRTAAALTYLHEAWETQLQSGGPFVSAQLMLQDMDQYARAGMVRQALDTIQAVEARLGEAFGSLSALGYLDVAIVIDSVELLESAVEATEGLIEQFGLEAVRPGVLQARGRIHELNGRCVEALPLYRQALAQAPTIRGFRYDIARCLAGTGEVDAAIRMLRDDVRTWPASPVAFYELAGILHRAGRDAEARTELDRALAFWTDADPQYRPLQEAQALLAELP